MPYKRVRRRQFLQAAASGAVVLAAPALGAADTSKKAGKKTLQYAAALADKFVAWQSTYGAPDIETCPYRTPGIFGPGHFQSVAPMCRALYRLYDEIGTPGYKAAADRYAVFLMNAIHDPPVPHTNLMTLDGKTRHLLSPAWLFGKALAPCYEWFNIHNPKETAFELKAHAVYRWLQRHRRPDSYFGVGYPISKDIPDGGFSCDLSEVGGGLIGFYERSKQPAVLKDAFGLANFFLTEYTEGSGNGVWSPQLGVWLVGPWPGGGAEHHTDQSFNRAGWGWSCYIAGEFLTRLRKYADEKTRALIDDRCSRALAWCFDACQFEDGAHGMFGRDDKWLGMGACAILLYLTLYDAKMLSSAFEAKYRPRAEKSWTFLLEHASPETFPQDGYIKVTGKTSKKPLENLAWLMSWTAEALIEGGKVFGDA